jgi:hypothetical protein
VFPFERKILLLPVETTKEGEEGARKDTVQSRPAIQVNQVAAGDLRVANT